MDVCLQLLLSGSPFNATPRVHALLDCIDHLRLFILFWIFYLVIKTKNMPRSRNIDDNNLGLKLLRNHKIHISFKNIAKKIDRDDHLTLIKDIAYILSRQGY